MKLAADSQLKFEAFFRELYDDDSFRLPPIYFYAGNFSRFLTKILKIYGITIGSRIFIKPDFISAADDSRIIVHVELAAHEIAHVLQYEREGFVRFFYKYFRSFRQNLKNKSWNTVSRQEAYLEIPFEIQARETAARFVEWNKRKRKMDND